MPTPPFRRLVVAASAAVVLLSACADLLPGDGAAADQPVTVRLYGTDGTMHNSFAAELSDRTLVAGMKGTRPMPRLPDDFVDRALDLDSSLQDLLYAGQAYDAVAISALAAELAGTPDPEVVRDYIHSVTAGGEECRSVAECLELAREGRELQYRGVSLTRGGFTDDGEPAASTYETTHFNREGVIDFGRSEFIGAGDTSRTSSREAPEPQPRTDLPSWQVEPLRIGGLLPETGGLSFAYPPIIVGVRLALADINDAGGVFGVEVEWFDGDDGTDPEVARATIAAHAEAGVHVLIGPAASGVAEAVMPDAAAAELIMFSPSNTASHLVEVDHGGWYFRTAPPDTLQAAALADILLRDGRERIVIVARNDSYGAGLQRDLSSSLQQFGMAASATTLVTYDPPGDTGGAIPDLDRLVQEVLEAEPDGLVVIGYDEAAQVIERLVHEGLSLQR